MVRGQVTLSQALMVLMLSYSFFSAMRALMNATHSALTGIAAYAKRHLVMRDGRLIKDDRRAP